MEATLSLPIISTYHVLKLTSFVDRLYANLLGMVVRAEMVELDQL